MSELITERIRAQALKLGLSHLAETVEVLLARAEAEQLGYLQLLDLLLEDEVGLREGRRFRNALNLSGLPHRKTGLPQLVGIRELDPQTSTRSRPAGRERARIL